ncbi:hypothetical protein MVEN_01754900 [Mycena venus]|uniref:DUF6533 domain-containing protein n=1 Tax=Mycena venus TaxID=2733690 RepID=A0A8H6XMZ3_9AGAR|nr:hypothetical protein MVEN_01754900 [Mycena venus]
MADATAVAQALRLHHYLYLAPLTFLYWDHLLTFGDEVRYIWSKPKTASAYCFFLNRYLAAFGDLAVTVFYYHEVPQSWSAPFPDILNTRLIHRERCPDLNLARQILLIVNQITVCLLLTVRIYALYGRDKRIISCMLGVGAVLIAVSIWAASRAGGVPQRGEPGCNIADPRNVAIMIAIPWEAVFVYDVMIFCLLFYKSLQTRRDSGLRWSQIPLLSLLIRDGSIYFVLMATVNLANILTSYIAEPLLVSCLSTFASNMSVTMMSRLMLNLHSVDSRAGIFSTSTPCATSITELDTLRTHDLERSAHIAPPRPKSVQLVAQAPMVVDPEPWGNQIQDPEIGEFTHHLADT